MSSQENARQVMYAYCVGAALRHGDTGQVTADDLVAHCSNDLGATPAWLPALALEVADPLVRHPRPQRPEWVRICDDASL